MYVQYGNLYDLESNQHNLDGYLCNPDGICAT